MRLPRRSHPEPSDEIDATLLLRSNLPISESRRAETKTRMLREARRVRDSRPGVAADAGSRDGEAAEVHTFHVEHGAGSMLMSNVEQLDADAAAQAADRVAGIAARWTQDRRR